MFHKSLALFALVPCVCPAQPAPAAIHLTLQRAMELATRAADPSIALAVASERVAEARYQEGRANLWPVMDVTTTGQNQTRNLGAEGFRFDTSVPGLTIPKSVGPFNTFDARVVLTETVFDLSAIRRLRVARVAAAAAQADTQSTRDDLAQQAAHAYAAMLREQARVAAVEAAILEARATLESARNKHAAGSGIAIDVTRAEYQLARQQQMLAGARAGRDRASLALAGALGLDLGAPLEFDDTLRYVPPQPFSPEQAVAAALRSRGDVEAARLREEQQQRNAAAVRVERLPTVAAYADAGALGGVETHTIGVALRIPVFDGGRVKAREAEATALVQVEQARQAQLRRNIELQIRQAQVTLRSTAEEVAASQAYVELAQAELAQARRRHDAGVTGALDVIEAQTHLATAENDRVEALFRYTEARIDASYAGGSIRNLSL